MKDRWVRIGLGVLVLGTWGAVLQRALRRPPAVTESTTAVTSAVVEQRPATAPEELPIIARDPFLDRGVPAAHASASPTRSAAPPAPRATKPEPASEWPEIRYNGIVRPHGTGGGVAFLHVGKHTLLLQRGQEMEGIRVMELSMDSVVVARNDERRTFRRQ